LPSSSALFPGSFASLLKRSRSAKRKMERMSI
jgi:hypothetical protein